MGEFDYFLEQNAAQKINERLEEARRPRVPRQPRRTRHRFSRPRSDR